MFNDIFKHDFTCSNMMWHVQNWFDMVKSVQHDWHLIEHDQTIIKHVQIWLNMFHHDWCWGYAPQIRLSADVRKCASCRSRIIETWFAGWNFGEYFSSAQEGDHCILMANPFSKSSRYKCVTFVNWDMYRNLKTLFLSIFLCLRQYIWFQSSSRSQIFESFSKI